MNESRSLRRKIKHEGSEEEKEIYKLGRNVLKLADKLYVGDRYKEKWDSFYILRTALKNNIEKYKGVYSDYFKNKLKEIEEQERQALGYHLH